MSAFPELIDADPEAIRSWARQLTSSLDRAIDIQGAGTVTLLQNAEQTIVSDQIATTGGAVMLTSTTSEAATALSTTYVDSCGEGSFIIGHANNATENRTFYYFIVEPDGDQV